MPFNHQGRETPDIVTSSEDYAGRFVGQVGEWFLQVQRNALLELVRLEPGATVLDVGGGHGQLLPALTQAGYDVTILGSDSLCARRIAGCVAAGQCRFDVGDLLHLPYADDTFDAVVAIRLMAHLTDWRQLLAEMTRVSRRVVLVEYPELASINALGAAMWKLKRTVEGNTRPYRCFHLNELAQALQGLGWDVAGHRAQYAIPMVLHRLVGRVGLSRRAEALCGTLGLTQKWGSPVLLLANKGGEV